LTYREIDLNKRYKIKLPSLITVIINTAIGLILAYLGPFGSFALPMSKRLIFWIILVAIGHLIYFHIDRFSQWYFQNSSIRPYIINSIKAVVSALFLSLFVFYMSYYFLNLPINKEAYLFIFPKVFILGIIINILIVYWNKLNSQNKASKSKQSHAVISGQDFINRIPNKLGNKLICFCMEDHYLNVYTQVGNHMILMRMKDALIELKSYKGTQVHRSWWVATDAIKQVVKKDRKMSLIMVNNMQVPVSQKYHKVALNLLNEQ